MLDIKFLRDNPDVVRQNIKNKFQDHKLPLVDEVIALDAENRAIMQEADGLRGNRNKLSKQIGALMGQGKKEEAEEVKKQVGEQSARLAECEAKEAELAEKIKSIMMVLPWKYQAGIRKTVSSATSAPMYVPTQPFGRLQ